MLVVLAAVPAVLAFSLAQFAPELIEYAWWPPALGLVVAFVLGFVLRRNYVLVLFAAGLAGLAARSAGQGRLMLGLAIEAEADDAFPTFDLANTGLPDPPPPFATVHGYFRDGWTLDEYAVEHGKLPDQSSTPGAILVPFVGRDEDTIDLSERQGVSIIVARVAPNIVTPKHQRTTLSGRTSALAPDILQTLVVVQGGDGNTRGILIDTLAIPTPREAWIELGLAFAALLTACGAAFFASAAPPES